MRISRALGVVAAVVAGACSDNGYSGPSFCAPTATQVCMYAYSSCSQCCGCQDVLAFLPPSLTVTAGTTVTWRDGSGVNHTVTSDPGAAETFNQSVSAGASFSHAFNTAGTFKYHCTLHGSMYGTITVN